MVFFLEFSLRKRTFKSCLCRLNISFKIYPYILSTTKCTLNFKPLFLRLLIDLLVLLDNCNIFFQGFMALMLHLHPPPCICQSRYSFLEIHQSQYTIHVFHSVCTSCVKMRGSLESPGNQIFKSKSKK